MGALFLDLKKAFDAGNHELPLNKLIKHFFSQQALSWFKSYLESHEQCIEINNSVSSLQNWNLHTQGFINGLLLFCLYINELLDSYKDRHCRVIESAIGRCLTQDNSAKPISMCFCIRLNMWRFYNDYWSVESRGSKWAKISRCCLVLPIKIWTTSQERDQDHFDEGSHSSSLW